MSNNSFRIERNLMGQVTELPRKLNCGAPPLHGLIFLCCVKHLLFPSPEGHTDATISAYFRYELRQGLRKLQMEMEMHTARRICV